MEIRIEHIKEPLKHLGEAATQISRHPVTDTGFISAAFATFFGWLPNVTALFALVYLLIRIWETETVKGWTGR